MSSPFSIRDEVTSASGDQFFLHSEYMNAQMPRVLRTIGFDKNYVRAEGAYLYDADGNRYLDLLSGYGAFNLGRYHPTVVAAIQETLTLMPPSLVQMDTPLLAGLLAKELVLLSPPHLRKVFFCNSGAEAIETAIKFARCFTGRSRILHLEHSFHGLTTGALSLNGGREFRDRFGPLLESTPVAIDDVAQAERELARGDVAAFVIEPIQGKGVYIPSDEYLLAIQSICRKVGTLVIADEIQTGMGRTGSFFAFQHTAGFEPDIVTMAKSLAGGLVPIGACIARPEVLECVFDQMDRCVVHSSTFKQNSLAMAAGLAALHVLREEQLPERARRLGERISSGLKILQTRYEMIHEIRGRGLMIGIEFRRPTSMSLKIAWDLLHRVNAGLFAQMIVSPLMDRHRILTQVAGHHVDIIKLLPPLVISEADADYFLNAFEDVVRSAHRFPSGVWSFGQTLVKNSLSRAPRPPVRESAV